MCGKNEQDGVLWRAEEMRGLPLDGEGVPKVVTLARIPVEIVGRELRRARLQQQTLRGA